MKLKTICITHTTKDYHLMLDPTNTLFSGIIQSNETAGFIIQCLKQDITKDELVNRLCEEYDVDLVTAIGDVERVLKQLKNINVIE